MDLYDRHGHRKYLTASELRAFLCATNSAGAEVGTFCQTLAYCGVRISEALALTTDRVDIEDGVLIFESLKKRQRGVYRAIPVPTEFLALLAEVHGIAGRRRGGSPGARVWPWSRATAWRRVSEVMDAAGVSGMHASPRGLRHGFGIRAAAVGVPLNMTQKWLGHADLATTAIYADATGPEERDIARRMWA